MKRTNIQKADAILTSDWHLRESTPICRIDNFWQTQWEKVRFIAQLQITHGCPVLDAGDLFDNWKPSPFVLQMALNWLPQQMHTIYGNHDLPQHNLELQAKTGLKVLETAKAVTILPGTHWGQEPAAVSFTIKDRKILVYHVMNYQGPEPWPGCTDYKAATLLRKYPKYDLILTGHNHKSFIEEHQNRLLVNPGSIMRQEAGQIDFHPRVYLYYTATNTVKPVYIPIIKESVTRIHVKDINERNDRIEAFISKLNNDWKADLNFEENIQKFCTINKIKPSVQSIINKALNYES